MSLGEVKPLARMFPVPVLRNDPALFAKNDTVPAPWSTTYKSPAPSVATPVGLVKPDPMGTGLPAPPTYSYTALAEASATNRLPLASRPRPEGAFRLVVTAVEVPGSTAPPGPCATRATTK